LRARTERRGGVHIALYRRTWASSSEPIGAHRDDEYQEHADRSAGARLPDAGFGFRTIDDDPGGRMFMRLDEARDALEE
jgi:hypothetical protein